MNLQDKHTFYICYFGLREPLVQTQVIAYLETLVSAGMRVSLLTFETKPKETWTDEELAAWRAKMKGKNIEWHYLEYHKRPTVPATFYDILTGVLFIKKRLRKEKIDVMHARSSVAALIGSLVKTFSWNRPKLIFDIRGLVTEEYVDAGVWKRDGFLHKIAKVVEPWLLNSSDGFVILTKRARQLLFPRYGILDSTDEKGRPLEVIPSCVDWDRYNQSIKPTSRQKVRDELGIGERETYIYVGSFGGWYLTDEIIDFLRVSRKRNPLLFVIFLTHHTAKPLAEKLYQKGFTDKDFVIKKVSPYEVPEYLAASDVSLSFVKPCFSKLSSSPTKIAEYLASSLPVISTTGIGDVDELLLGENVGRIVYELNENSYNKTLDEIELLQTDKTLPERCRQSAANNFNLQTIGKVRYRRLYERVLQGKPLHTLYLCYFGVEEPLVQTQVIPYLKQIASAGIKVTLLTFEPDGKNVWNEEQETLQREQLASAGINWYWKPYRKSPSLLAAISDLWIGVRQSLSLIRNSNISIIHARAHVPVFMGLVVKLLTKCRVIFDIRGLMAEEYVDAKVWEENSLPFKAVKLVEKVALKFSDQVVVLTNRMKHYLVKNNLRSPHSIEVIPCCMDFSRLKGEVSPIKKAGNFELIYAGTTSGLYLLKEMGRFFSELKKLRPKAFFRVLTASSPTYVQEVFDKLGIETDSYTVQRVSPSLVTEYLKKADLGISFRTPTFSQIAASPTKVPEYLSCGIPVIHNVGVGDTNDLLGNEKVGINVESFDQESLARVAQEALELLNSQGIKERCIEVARKSFNLTTVGREGYLNVYRRLGFDDNRNLLKQAEESSEIVIQSQEIEEIEKMAKAHQRHF